MMVPRLNLVSALLAVTKVEKKEKPQPRPEPSPLERLFLFILIELENMKKSGKPKT